MKRSKKLQWIAWLMAGVMLLSGCSLSKGMDELLKPPQLSETRQLILSALRGAIGGSYDLHSPMGGQYRTAIITTDLTGDGQNEAVCFFTSPKVAGGVSFMVLRQQQEKWVSMGIYTSDASGIDKVTFCDINADGVGEIVAGWRYPTGKDNGVEVVAVGQQQPTLLYSGLYAQFEVLPQNQLIIISHAKSVESTTVSASLLGYQDGVVKVVSSVPMDNRVQDYLAVQVGTIAGGSAALFVDTQLDNANYTTEILVVNKDGFLENKLYTQRVDNNNALQRAVGIKCLDVNEDGILDIPITEPLPAVADSDVPLYITHWHSFDGEQFTQLLTTYTSAANQFYFVLPEKWVGKITVQQDAQNERLYRFVTVKDHISLFDLRIFTSAEFNDEVTAEGWNRIAEASDKLAAYHPYQHSNLEDVYRLSGDDMSQRFYFIL